MLAYRVTCRDGRRGTNYILPPAFIRDYAAHVADPENPEKWAGTYPLYLQGERLPVLLDLRCVSAIRLCGVLAN